MRRKDLTVAACAKCNSCSVWHNETMVYPSGGTAPLPNPDLPADVQADYQEARSIAGSSPRGAAALLRLGVQKLCKHLGGAGKDINKDIAGFVKNGLDARVQKAMDTVRVVGNNAVHPGQIDLNDDPSTVAALFKLINYIADQMITNPKHVDEVFDALPEGAKAAIAERDGAAQQSNN